MSIIAASHSRVVSGWGKVAVIGPHPGGHAPTLHRGVDGLAAKSRSSVFHGTPAREEILAVHAPEVLAHFARQARGGMGWEIPEEHDLATLDLDDLEVIDALRARQKSRHQPSAAHDQAKAATGSHRLRSPAIGRACLAAYAAASSSARSPWNTCSPTRTAGTSLTP